VKRFETNSKKALGALSIEKCLKDGKGSVVSIFLVEKEVVIAKETMKLILYRSHS